MKTREQVEREVLNTFKNLSFTMQFVMFTRLILMATTDQLETLYKSTNQDGK